MTAGALPSALLCAVLGLALAFGCPRVWVMGVICLVVTAVAIGLMPIAPRYGETIRFCCLIGIVLCAGAVHLPFVGGVTAAVGLSVNAGLWSGAVAGLSGHPLDLIRSLPCVLVVLPAAWLIGHRASVAVKILASWAIAVASLVAMLQLLPVTPGYMPDHLD